MSSSKPGPDEFLRALAFALRYTRSGVRSTHDVRRHLKRRGVPEHLSARVVADARRRGLIDDQACARLWADHWARRGYAGAAIRQRLAAKGLEGRVIDDAARLVGAASDEDRARLVMEAVIRRSAGRPVRPRLARALASRGFDGELIEQLLAQAAGPMPSDAER
jgi:regulatory protein